MIAAFILCLSFISAESTCDAGCQLAAAGIKVMMSNSEIDLLKSTLCKASTQRYLEFGSGGSTLAAAYCNVTEIVSLDNAKAWLSTVQTHRVWRSSTSHLQQLFIDTGQNGAFGRPIGNESYAAFIHYSHAILQYTSGAFDVILVDGRFRVACALVAMQRMHRNTVLLLHDYDRKDYHVLESVLQKVTQIEQLSQFKLPTTIDAVAVNNLVRQYTHTIS